jgi:hypothetical protein
MPALDDLHRLADRHPVLSVTATADLCARIRAGTTVDRLPNPDTGRQSRRYSLDEDARDALDLLVRHNARLGLRAATQFRGFRAWMGDDEFVSLLLDQLLHAARTFDPDGGTKWTSWYLRRLSFALRARYRRSLVGKAIPMDALVSLDDEWGEGPAPREALGDRDPRQELVFSDGDLSEMLDILDPALTSDRQREVLRELLGLRGRLTDIGSSEAPTMADIGHRLGISRERVRQLRGQIAERIASDPACRRWLEERGHGLQGRV